MTCRNARSTLCVESYYSHAIHHGTLGKAKKFRDVLWETSLNTMHRPHDQVMGSIHLDTKPSNHDLASVRYLSLELAGQMIGATQTCQKVPACYCYSWLCAGSGGRSDSLYRLSARGIGSHWRFTLRRW